MRVATFNVQNLRLRRKEAGPRLDGAWDKDVSPGAGDRDALAAADRRLTAEVLRIANADVVALQEVFDRETLDHFHDEALTPAGAAPYPHRICLPGNDGRGLDVALMSRRAPRRVESHAAETPASLGLPATAECAADARIFRRDCLEAEIAGIALFVCHFKAPYPDVEASGRIRLLEAQAVAALIRRRFADPAAALWLVLGDLNEPRETPAAGPAAAPLVAMGGVDLMLRLPEGERWSFHQPRSAFYSRPDAMIASPALAARFPSARPRIIRAGMEREAERYPGPRLAEVGETRPHASDHALVAIDLPGL